MKISVNWMKWYGGQGLDVPIDELVTRIGMQLGAVEAVENLGEKYQGIVVVKVVSSRDHPDSDHLHLCMVDDDGVVKDVARDGNGLVQVVCGANNIQEGMLAAWLPPGSTVPESVGKDPFVLTARDFRGQTSNGMLASLRELALGDDHDGILHIDDTSAKPGDDFAVTYGLDDYVIDIENKMFTHRPDCFGQLGVAREIAGISGQKFTSPDWYLNTVISTGAQRSGEIPSDVAADEISRQARDDNSSLPLEVRNELPELVPRFVAVPLSNVEIKPSPIWLQTYLLRTGVRPINNVVDITNYMMLLTAQPMHAYDYDKVRAQDGGDKVTLVVRTARPGEKIALLSGKTIEPREEAIMIATENKLIGVGGVMGGGDTEVDEHTKNIILEVATFDMYSIRRTSMAHGLFTDAVTRFNKGQSPLQNDKLAAKAIEMLRELAGGRVAGPAVDVSEVQGREWAHPPVPVTTQFINERLGLVLSAEQMQTLLQNVEFGVVTHDNNLTVTAPFWRTDIETREDIVEEVGRLYGFDKLPLELPRRTIAPAAKNELFELKSRLREYLAQAGANEVLTYSFVHGDLLQKVSQDMSEAFQVGNALSPDLQYYRLSLLPSLLDKVHLNIKAGYDEFALFELGKVHGHLQLDDAGLPKEYERLALVCAADPKTVGSDRGAPYYAARNYLEKLLSQLGAWQACTLIPLNQADLGAQPFFWQVLKPFDPARSAAIYDGQRILGVVGEFSASTRRALKLPPYSAGFEFGLNLITQNESVSNRYVPLPRFPKVTQDITLKVAADLPHQALQAFLANELAEVQPKQALASLVPLDIYQRPDDVTYKQTSFRLTIASYERTLTDAVVTKLLDNIADAAHQKFGAERI